MSRQVLVRATAAMLISVVSLLALEGAYRLYSWRRYGQVDYIDLISVGGGERDARYGWLPKKWFRTQDLPPNVRTSPAGHASHLDQIFTVNSLGYRGKEFLPHKGPGTFRIVAFGGSTTMCLEVDDADTWPAILERRLAEEPRFLFDRDATKVEVINAAAGSWRSREALLRLRDEVRNFEPDLLLLALNWNDFGYAVKELDPDAPMTGEKPWWLYSRVAQNLSIRYSHSRWQKADQLRRRREGLRRDAVWVERLTSHIQEMQDIAKTINAEVVLVNLPGLCRQQSFESNEIGMIVTRTRVTRDECPVRSDLKDLETALFQDIGRRHGIPVVDVHEYFERFSGDQRVVMFADEMHLTAQGTQETAQAIAQALSSRF